MIRQGDVEEIVKEILKRFRTVRGGRTSETMPTAAALVDERLQFAMGVDVRGVVAFAIASVSVERDALAAQLHATAKQLAAWGAFTDFNGQTPIPTRELLDAAQEIVTLLNTRDLLDTGSGL
jgi:hypothetical protein